MEAWSAEIQRFEVTCFEKRATWSAENQQFEVAAGTVLKLPEHSIGPVLSGIFILGTTMPAEVLFSPSFVAVVQMAVMS